MTLYFTADSRLELRVKISSLVDNYKVGKLIVPLMESYYISSAYLHRRVRWPELALSHLLLLLLPLSSSGSAPASTAIVQLCEACSKWEKLVCKPLASSVKFNILLATHTWCGRSGRSGKRAKSSGSNCVVLLAFARFSHLVITMKTAPALAEAEAKRLSRSSLTSNCVELIR